MIKFFRHNSTASEEPGLKYLRVKFGWEGLGKYWALCELISKQDNCTIDVSKKFNLIAIASTLEMEIDEFLAFKDFCIECEIMVCDGDIVSVPCVSEGLALSDAVKERNRKYYNKKKDLPKKESKPKQEPKPKPKAKAKDERSKALLSNCDHSLSEEDEEYFKIAKSFWSLFVSHHGTNKMVLNNAKYDKWVDSVRLMMQRDKRTKEELRKVIIYLKNSTKAGGDPFWINTIMSVSNVRKNFDKILSKAEVSENTTPRFNNAVKDSSYE